jgi:hypothetical protein
MNPVHTTDGYSESTREKFVDTMPASLVEQQSVY